MSKSFGRAATYIMVLFFPTPVPGQIRQAAGRIAQLVEHHRTLDREAVGSNLPVLVVIFEQVTLAVASAYQGVKLVPGQYEEGTD